MRGLRSFIVLLVIAVGLGAYVYFVESKRPADAGETRDKVFSGVEADKIEEIAIKSESGDRTTLKKSGSDWQIVQPVAAKPDPAEVSGLTSNLSSLEVQRVIDENPAHNALAQEVYGYDNSDVGGDEWLWQPRFGFNYTFDTERPTQLRGGLGLFQGQTHESRVLFGPGRDGRHGDRINHGTPAISGRCGRPGW